MTYVKGVTIESPLDGTRVAVDAEISAPLDGTRVAVDSEISSPLDSMTGAVETISYEHHEIHDGSSYEMCLVDTDLGSADWIAVAFTTPAGTKRCHVIYEWACKTSGHVELIEAPTLADGTSLTPVNHNQASSNTSDVTSPKTYNADDGDTVSGGTVIHSAYAFAARSSAPAPARGAEEFILKSSTSYAIKVTCDAASSGAWLCVIWYEHTDSN